MPRSVRASRIALLAIAVNASVVGAVGLTIANCTQPQSSTMDNPKEAP